MRHLPQQPIPGNLRNLPVYSFQNVSGITEKTLLIGQSEFRKETICSFAIVLKSGISFSIGPTTTTKIMLNFENMINGSRKKWEMQCLNAYHFRSQLHREGVGLVKESVGRRSRIFFTPFGPSCSRR